MARANDTVKLTGQMHRGLRSSPQPSAPTPAPACAELEIPARLQDCELAAVELMETISALEARLTPVLCGDVQGYAVDPEPAKTVLGTRISATTAMLRAASNRVKVINDLMEV